MVGSGLVWVLTNAASQRLKDDTQGTGDAVVQAPPRDPSDSCIAHSAEPALFVPEKTKGTSTPKRILHMGFFASFEVCFIGRVAGS